MPTCRKALRLAIHVGLCLVVSASLSLFYWLSSDFRASGIAASLAGCSPPPSYYLYRMPRDQLSFFTSEGLYLAPDLRKQSRDASVRIGMVQVCNQPARHSKHVNVLLDRHRSYSQKHGYEYQLSTKGEQHGVWAKITALRDKLVEELGKEEDRRLHWILRVDLQFSGDTS